MKNKLTPLALCLTLTACATQLKIAHKEATPSYKEATPSYPYHENGVVCYGLSLHNVTVGSGGQCIEMLMQAAIARAQYRMENNQ
jgi:hypothetical protein